MTVTRKIKKAIFELNEKADSGELAYLLLTGRAENHIRDLIAFNFSRLYPKHKVVREEERFDLRIYTPNNVISNIEFKIGFASAILTENKNALLIRGVNSDIKKRPKGLINCVCVIHSKTDDVNKYQKYRYKNLHISANNHKNIWKYVRSSIRSLWPKSKKSYQIVDCGTWDDIHVEMLIAILRNP